MKIGLDVDGVIADARAETKFRFISEFGESLWRSVAKHLHTSEAKNVPDGWMKAQFEDPTYWLNIKPFPDGWEMANKWFSEGHDVYLITARHDSEIAITERWLEEWDFIISDLISMPLLEKYKSVELLGLDIFVEDNPDEVKKISQYIPTFLIDAEYNRGIDYGHGVKVKSLYDVDRVVNRWQDLRLTARSAGSVGMLQSLIGDIFTEREARIG